MSDTSASGDTGQTREPGEVVMTETVRQLAQKARRYRQILRSLGIDVAKLESEGDRSGCPAYADGGTCRSGCWEEPICQTGEPEGGWPLARLRWGLRLTHEHEARRRSDTGQPPDVAAPLRSYRDIERVCTGLGLTGWDGGWKNDRVTVYGPRGPEDEESEVVVHAERGSFHVPMGAPAAVLDTILRALLAADTTPVVKR